MGNYKDPDNRWCYFHNVQNFTHTLVIVDGCLLVITMLGAIYFFILNMRQTKNRNTYRVHPFTKFYALLIGYLFLYIVEMIINISAYYTFINNHNEKQDKCLILLSVIVSFIQHFRNLVLFTLLFQIPCIWLYNILEKCLEANQGKLTFEQKENISNMDKYMKWIKKYIYSKYRWIILSCIYLGFSAYTYNENCIGQYSFVIWVLVIFESLFASIIYIFGYLTMRKYDQYIPFSPKLKKQIKKQYLALTICCIIRTTVNISLEVFFNSEQVKFNDNCSWDGKQDGWFYLFYSCYLTLATVVMSIIPSIVVLYAYRPQRIPCCKQETNYLLEESDHSMQRRRLEQERKIRYPSKTSQSRNQEQEQIQNT